MSSKKMIKLYLILLAISILLIFIRPLSALGQSFFIALVTMIFTYYFTKNVFEAPKIKRWNSIKNKVTSELNEEFSGILTDMAMICHFNKVVSFAKEPSKEEVWKKYNQAVLDQLKLFSENKNLKINEHYTEKLLEGNFGNLFKKREEFLNQFQLKYLDYLQADVISTLIDVQKSLHRIDQNIIIRNKQVENRWLRLDTDEKLLELIEKNFRVVVDGIQFMANKGILKYH